MKNQEFLSREVFSNKVKKDQSQNDVTPFKNGVIGKKITEGSFSDIYDVNKLGGGSPDKIIKIGKTENFVAPFFKDKLRIRFPRKILNDIFVKFLGPNFQIQPDEDFIKNGVAEYLVMKEYFGANEKDFKNSSQNKRKELIASLKDKNNVFYNEMVQVLGDDVLVAKASQILEAHQDDNFLPEEQTVIGHPPNLTQEKVEELKAKGEEIPVTNYIFQEKITGDNIVSLGELKDEELFKNPQLVEELLIFSILTKKMYSDIGKLIDTRSEEVGRHPFEWFQKTANILVDKDKQKIFFVDTRLLWDKNSRAGQGGIDLIKHLGIRSVNRAIKKYATMLKSIS